MPVFFRPDKNVRPPDSQTRMSGLLIWLEQKRQYGWNQMAASPDSPVRMRTTLLRSLMKIFPSPTWPVWAE